MSVTLNFDVPYYHGSPELYNMIPGALNLERELCDQMKTDPGSCERNYMQLRKEACEKYFNGV